MSQRVTRMEEGTVSTVFERSGDRDEEEDNDDEDSNVVGRG